MNLPIQFAEAKTKELDKLNIKEGIQALWQEFPDQISFSTSFSLEDQVILQAISELELPLEVFTLDTGRLFPETYSTWERSLERFDIPIQAYFPDSNSIQKFVDKNGPNSFYKSIELRKECCHIRKVIPLKKALMGVKVWISGLRAEHSNQRENLKIFEWDEGNQVYKYYPLLFWTEPELRKVINSEGVPYNILFDRNFPSIGCQPCTRAIKPGEPMRAGRWWWENADQNECGLHEIKKTSL